MNILYLLVVLSALASDCIQYELRGTVSKKDDVFLTINEGTNSQKVFRFSHKVELAMAPFLGKFISGKFTVDGLVITKVENPDLSIPDPLFHKNSQICIKKRDAQNASPSKTKITQ